MRALAALLPRMPVLFATFGIGRRLFLPRRNAEIVRSGRSAPGRISPRHIQLLAQIPSAAALVADVIELCEDWPSPTGLALLVPRPPTFRRCRHLPGAREHGLPCHRGRRPASTCWYHPGRMRSRATPRPHRPEAGRCSRTANFSHADPQAGRGPAGILRGRLDGTWPPWTAALMNRPIRSSLQMMGNPVSAATGPPHGGRGHRRGRHSPRAALGVVRPGHHPENPRGLPGEHGSGQGGAPLNCKVF